MLNKNKEKLRSLVISDTHNQHEKLNLNEFDDKSIDMIIHCGDFSNDTEKTSNNFINWYGNLPYKYKILISGNHDKYAFENNESFKKKCKELNIIYLEDEEIIIEGIKFYGTPWVPDIDSQSFMKDDFELYNIWEKIPLDTEVLITHTPQAYVLDIYMYQYIRYNTGSKTLREKIQKLKKLKYHLFGHIHNSYGKSDKNYNDLNYISINASTSSTKGLNKPFIIEV